MKVRITSRETETDLKDLFNVDENGIGELPDDTASALALIASAGRVVITSAFTIEEQKEVYRVKLAEFHKHQLELFAAYTKYPKHGQPPTEQPPPEPDHYNEIPPTLHFERDYD